MAEPTTVVIYTDGACSGNPGPGGWAAILRYGAHEKVIQGGASLTTNNRMELRAALSALMTLTRPCRVEIHTDSEYLRLGVTRWMPSWIKKHWRRSDGNPVKNRDLWQALNTVASKHEISWLWVKGHAGDDFNERADRLAVAALNTLGVNGQPDLEAAEAIIP